ncbi:hypothetical protein HID58_018034 [Brassica napus]|uniref:Uncharacterized protein n=1 Tax=Brassica napus TaxID=3708 RepID=A0ABQ8DAH8_BRANA|nr:hypothetical protein HID58_018034 [Brassica napus]
MRDKEKLDSPLIFLQMHYAMNADSEKEIVDTDSNKTFVLDKPTTARDDFLSAARSLVNQGQPSQALQAVLCVSLFHFPLSRQRFQTSTSILSVQTSLNN